MSGRTSKERRDDRGDAAEHWLKGHDKEYGANKRTWQTPSTDALARLTVPFEMDSELDDEEEQCMPGHERIPPATALYDSADYARDPKQRGEHRPKRARLSDWQKAARDLIANGYSIRETARLVGMPESTLRKKLRANQ